MSTIERKVLKRNARRDCLVCLKKPLKGETVMTKRDSLRGYRIFYVPCFGKPIHESSR